MLSVIFRESKKKGKHGPEYVNVIDTRRTGPGRGPGRLLTQERAAAVNPSDRFLPWAFFISFSNCLCALLAVGGGLWATANVQNPNLER